MSKKENSTLLMICGALVSLVIFLAIALAFLGIILFLFVKLPAEPMIGLFAISLMVAIFVSFFLSLFIYQKVLKWFMAKFNKEGK